MNVVRAVKPLATLKPEGIVSMMPKLDDDATEHPACVLQERD
jgi:hypothetical protein